MSSTQFFLEHRLSIRKRLPHGSIMILAKALGISNISVEKCFTAGWTKERHPEILRRSMLLIEATAVDEQDNLFIQNYKDTILCQPA